MKGRHRGDAIYGTQDVGGLVFATVQCPIFDTREGDGNFFVAEDNNLDLSSSALPPTEFDPYQDGGFVYVVNVLNLPYYEISEQYHHDDSGFTGLNWKKLLDVGSEIFNTQGSVAKFIERIIVRVRLAHFGGWEKNSKKYIMQVTTPAFGQITRDESVAYPIFPISHNSKSLRNLSRILEGVDGKTKKPADRTKPNSDQR